MTYSNPIATIASVGGINTPIPVLIESNTEPTQRDSGTPLQVGDVWYNKLTQVESIYVLSAVLNAPGWQPVGGAGYINEVIDTTPTDDIVIPPATTEKIGGVIVGTGLNVSSNGTLTIDPVEDLQTLTVHGTSTLHTIITGADADGIAINAGAGQIIGQWANLGQNPTANTGDVNYGVGLRTSGKIICGELVPTQIICGGTIIGNTVNATIVEGARQGLVYKLQAGTGLTFEGQLHTYIGGTVGNDYNTNTGTLGINEAIVVTKTGAQTINGDLFLTGAGPNASGTLNSQKLNLNNYATLADLGAPNVGSIAFANSQPYYSNGLTWTKLNGGGTAATYVLPVATDTELGGIKVGNGLQITAAGVLSTTGSGGTPYTLPPATDAALGGVIVGSGLSVAVDGTISNDNPTPYSLPAATDAALGGVKVGAGLGVTADGTLSADVQSAYQLPQATQTDLGGVRVGESLTLANDATINVPLATPTEAGAVIVGEGISVTNGVISVGAGGYTLAPATTSTLGGIIVGDGLTVTTDGTLTAVAGAPAVLLDGGGTITSGNVILDDGYVRAERALTTDAAFEARVGTTLNFKVLAGGGVAIGGTIDEGATQSAANTFLNTNGDITQVGKHTAKNTVTTGASNAGYSANLASGNVKVGQLEVVDGNNQAQNIETVNDIKVTGNVYPADVNNTNTVGTDALPFDAFYGSSITFGQQLPGNTRTVTSTTFNDYEKGTWVGTLDQVMESGSPTQTLGGTTTATGQYERIGNHVFISISFPAVVIPGNEVANNPGNNGIATVTGLPFNASTLHDTQLEGDVQSVNMLTDISEISNSVQLVDPFDKISAGAGTTGFMRLGCIFTAGQSYVNFGLGGTERLTHYDDNYAYEALSTVFNKCNFFAYSSGASSAPDQVNGSLDLSAAYLVD